MSSSWKQYWLPCSVLPPFLLFQPAFPFVPCSIMVGSSCLSPSQGNTLPILFLMTYFDVCPSGSRLPVPSTPFHLTQTSPPGPLLHPRGGGLGMFFNKLYFLRNYCLKKLTLAWLHNRSSWLWIRSVVIQHIQEALLLTVSKRTLHFSGQLLRNNWVFLSNELSAFKKDAEFLHHDDHLKFEFVKFGETIMTWKALNDNKLLV